jgi:hypothetical protein
VDLSTDDASSYEMKTEIILVNHAAGTKWNEMETPAIPSTNVSNPKFCSAHGLFEHCDLCAESQPLQAQLLICLLLRKEVI